MTVAESFLPAEFFFPDQIGHMVHVLNLIERCALATKVTNLFSAEPEIGVKGIQWVPLAHLTPEVCTRRGWQALQAAGLCPPLA